MEFYTQNGLARPVRLFASTRQFAFDSLEGKKYGLDTLRVNAVTLDGTEGYETLTKLQK